MAWCAQDGKKSRSCEAPLLPVQQPLPRPQALCRSLWSSCEWPQLTGSSQSTNRESSCLYLWKGFLSLQAFCNVPKNSFQGGKVIVSIGTLQKQKLDHWVCRSVRMKLCFFHYREKQRTEHLLLSVVLLENVLLLGVVLCFIATASRPIAA